MKSPGRFGLPSGSRRSIFFSIFLVIPATLLFLLSGCLGVPAGEYEESYPAEAEYAPEAPMMAKQRSEAPRPAARAAASEMLAAAPEEDINGADSGSMEGSADGPGGLPILGGATGQGGPEGTDGGSGEGTGSENQARKRLRVYSAELELAVTSVEKSREELIRTAEEAGGYIESSALDYLVLRVPAESFEEILEAVEATGTILSRAVRTADVTEQFSDLERRIELSERTRERLYALLEKAEETAERVKILREIRRLTEEIERLRAQLESLDELIRFSRITVHLRARISRQSRSREAIPFGWIARLDPIGVTAGKASRGIDIRPPEDFAVFYEGKNWLAETAEGTRLKAGAGANEPRGDSEFWAEALFYHLGDYYRRADRISYGVFRGVLFESKDPDPFYYLIAVHVLDTEILVAEAFFPDRTALDRRREQVASMLKEGYQE